MSATDTLAPVKAMLPEWFIDWWFAPWDYAPQFAGSMGNGSSLLGRIDGYRFLCDEYGVLPDLPGGFDSDWHVAALTDGTVLAEAAGLFAGLMAARERNMPMLGQLQMESRRWCLSTAMTQPLRALTGLSVEDTIQDNGESADTLVTIGLVELALRLEQGFPGMWARVRLLLDADQADAADNLLEHHVSNRAMQAAAALTPAAIRRAQKCWEYCCVRATASH